MAVAEETGHRAEATWSQSAAQYILVYSHLACTIAENTAKAKIKTTFFGDTEIMSFCITL